LINDEIPVQEQASSHYQAVRHEDAPCAVGNLC